MLECSSSFFVVEKCYRDEKLCIESILREKIENVLHNYVSKGFLLRTNFSPFV